MPDTAWKQAANWLIPVDAELRSDADVESEAVGSEVDAQGRRRAAWPRYS
jgi:hypothetical protein